MPSDSKVLKSVDVVVIGGGQSALATAYFLRRAQLSYVILDNQDAPGGAWRHAWDSLHLFSPAQWSSLPGWPMPPQDNKRYPDRHHVVDYLDQYERRYGIPVVRPTQVVGVTKIDSGLVVKTDNDDWQAQAVVSATGTWGSPHIPYYAGLDLYQGTQVHSANYRNPAFYEGKRVLVIGGGNSGAQIFSDLSTVCAVTWVTLDTPQFLPEDVDGRVLFERATQRWKALVEGTPDPVPPGGLSDIVMVPPVLAARERGVLQAVRPPIRFTERGVVWPDGKIEDIDSVVWCTGFRPALKHLDGLGVIDAAGRVDVKGTRAQNDSRLWLVGYGDWTGFASATLIGTMRAAKSTVAEIQTLLGHP